MTRIPLALILLSGTAAIAGAAQTLAEALPAETARTLTEHGDILPLAEVLTRAGIEGDIIGVALHREDGRYLYKIKTLGQGGQYREYRVDAKNGSFLESDRRR
jgi:uncharacterized membrane protein YkoI